MAGIKIIKLDAKAKYQRLISREFGSLRIKSGHVILKSGENIGEHSTEDKEEALIILKGKGKVRIDKKDTHDIEQGMFIYIPPKTLHDVKNTGLDILEYIFTTSNI